MSGDGSAVDGEWICHVPIYSNGGVQYLRRDDLKRVLTQEAWLSLTDWYGIRTGHADGPYLKDVEMWLSGYTGPAFRKM